MEKTNNKKQNVYNLVIMDKSGSMSSIKDAAIEGFNDVLAGVRKLAKDYADTKDQKMSLVLFDTSSMDEVAWNADPEKVEFLNNENYRPCACTPLYDAMGRNLTKLEKEVGNEDASVMVTIITDGYENASTDYNLKDIKELINRLKEKGWSFAYMGTDHDVDAVTVDLSITNVIKFEKNLEETKRAFARERRAKERWMENEKLFDSSCPCYTSEDKIAFMKRAASHYYDEDWKEGSDNADSGKSDKSNK
ncbi:MAG: VWA domain-containing protein [Bacteroidales bacterium]|nr:VWA domain-containing protein [Bacteroidales bacterium]